MFARLEEARIVKHMTGTTHMLLLVAATAVALLLGWGLGWVLALAVIGCGAMVAVVFWLGRSSAEHVTDRPVGADEAVERQ